MNTATHLPLLLLAFAYTTTSCTPTQDRMKTDVDTPAVTETVFFGAGCFWCSEAIFSRVPGVLEAESGYQGGDVAAPTYEEVCNGTTGHAEVCRIVYTPETVSLEQLLEQFWQMHDPTSLNRQGADVGTQYRSAVFCTTEAQLQTVRSDIERLDASGEYARPVVTEVAMAPEFYSAENYHQDYYELNRKQPYCALVIAPKIKRMEASD